MALAAAEMLAADGIHARVLDMHTIKPLDQQAVLEAAQETGCIVTVENHNIIGGLGSAVAEVVVENCPVPMKRVGIKDRFGEVGDRAYLRKCLEIDTPNIVDAVMNLKNSLQKNF